MTLNRHTIKPGTPGHGTAEHGTAGFGWTAEHLGKVTKERNTPEHQWNTPEQRNETMQNKE